MIEVPCHCGKTYRVTPDKAGRKLQCKRCGAIQRIPRQVKTDTDEALVVPFQMPGGDEGWGDDRLAIPEAPPLQLKQPLRRCPSCGTQDEGNVVLCVRCGFDWRTGRRMEDAYEEKARETHTHSVVGTEQLLDGLVRLGWAALSPVGVILGPYVIGRSLRLEQRLRASDADADEFQRLAQVRLTAISGTLLWALVLVFAVLALKGRGGDQVAEAVECRNRLERVGRVIRERVGEGPFPAQGEFTSALIGLTSGDSPSLNAVSLYCPIEGGLYSFGRRDQELLTTETSPEYLLLWDVESHADALGKVGFRALRFDGTIETFPSRSELQEACRRASYRQLAAVGEGSVGGSSTPRDGGGDPELEAQAIEKQAKRFLGYAQEWADDDPELQAFVDEESFLEEIGVPADRLLPALLKGKSERARAAAALMLVRVRIPSKIKLQLAKTLRDEDDPRLRLAAGIILQQVGDPAWVLVLASVAEDGSPEHVRAARRILAREASRSADTTRSILGQAAAVRAKTGAAGDDAIFPLPPEALQHVVPLLADQKLRREAAAVLYSADGDGVDALMATVSSPDRELRLAVFEVLNQLRVKGVMALEEFLDVVSAEVEPEVRGLAVRELSRAVENPARGLVLWSLEALRKRPSGALDAACRKILSRVGLPDAAPPSAHEEGLGWLLDELRESGDHTALIDELGASARVDEKLDQQVRQRWKRIPDAGARRQLIKLMEARLHEASLRVLLQATEDEDPEVREAALAGLHRSGAPQSPQLRKEVGRMLATRLRAERAIEPRAQLLKLARGGRYCGIAEGHVAQHRCNANLLRTLKKLVSDGNRAALSCLATHPNEQIPPFFAGLMVSDKDDSSLRGDLAGALRSMTKIPSSTADGPTWQQLLNSNRARIGDVMRAKAAESQRKIAEEYQDAQERLRRLREQQR